MQLGRLDFHDVNVPGHQFNFPGLRITVGRCPGHTLEDELTLVAGEDPEILQDNPGGIGQHVRNFTFEYYLYII